MEKQDRRKFIKIAGKALLVTSGVTVFGLTSARPKAENEENRDEYYSDGYYDDGYYDDGYYDDGYSTSINRIRKDSLKLVVAPNPSDGNFELTMSAQTAEHATILINDLSGKKLVHKIHVLQPGANRIAFQTDALARGVYELKVITHKGEGSLRLLIAK